MAKRFYWLIVSFCLAFGVIFVSPIQAASDQPLTLTEPELTAHIADLSTLYRDQIEAYRNSERQYQLHLTQYQQLKTLTSREEAVTSAANTMVLRARVLITYFELLHAKMVEADGVSLADKEELSPQIISYIEDLKTHLAQTESITSQEELNQRADEFISTLKAGTNLSKRVLFLLDLGQTREYLLTAETFFDEVKEKQLELPLGAIKQAERDRAYKQIDDLLQSVAAGLTEQMKLVVPADGKFQESGSKSEEALTALQTSLLKAVNYLQELANLI